MPMPFYESGRALLLILPVFSLKSIAFEPDFNIVGTTFVSDIAYSRILNHLIINFFMKRKVTLSLLGEGVFRFSDRLRLSFSLLLVFCCGLSLMAQTIAPQEVEPNGTVATAMPITTNPAKMRGYIYPNGDVDLYSFSAVAGNKVFAAVMTSFSANGSTDSQLRLIASDGTTVIEFDENDGSFGSTSSNVAGATIPTTGTYYLQVNHASAANQLRPYDLYLQVQTGSAVAETEANNTAATANVMPASGFVSGTINPAADADFYSVTLAAGESVFLCLDQDPERDNIAQWNAGRLGFGLFGNATDLVLVANDVSTGSVANPLSEAFFFTVKQAGTYYIFVDQNVTGGAATSTYQLSFSKFAPTTPGAYTTYTSTDVPKVIPTGPGIVSSTLNIPDSKLIKDITVTINLNHTFMQDLDVHLTAPNGANMALFTDIGAATTGGAQTQMDMFFNDNCAIPSSFAVTTSFGVTPELAAFLDLFKGVNAQGNWTLDLRDDATGDGGTLNSWSISILEDNTPTTVAGYTSVYSTDFEANDGGFTHTGTADEWERGTPVGSATNPIGSAFSGTQCWKTDLDNTYDINSNQTLASPNIAIPTGTTYISWAMKYHIESASFDTMKVYVEEVGNPSNNRVLFRW